MSTIIALVIAYLIGSLPVAILLSKVLKKPDPRTAGSGNAGATNILRLIGKKEALIVLLGDGLKGLIAVWIGAIFGLTTFQIGLVAFAAVVGHIFPVFFKFKGGKGVATAIGGVLGCSFLAGVLAAIAWAAIAFITRYASLASIVAMILAPVFLMLFSLPGYLIPAVLIAALVIWKHKDNITRLKSNTETKIQL